MNFYQRPSEFVIWEIATPKGMACNAEDGTEAKLPKAKKVTSNALLAPTTATIPEADKLKIENLGKFVASPTAVPAPPRKSVLRKRSVSTPVINVENTRQSQQQSPIHSRPTTTAVNKPSKISLDNPRPHHFEHPEFYVDSDLIRSGKVRSRSSSLSRLMQKLKPKTPPSPHHHIHPLKTIKISDSYQLISKQKKNCLSDALDGELPSILSENRDRSAKKVKKVTSKAVKHIDAEKFEKRKPSKITLTSEEELAQKENERKMNDFHIENTLAQHVFAKRRGEAMHLPMQRVFIDLGPFFTGKTNVTASPHTTRNRLTNGKFQMNLDTTLLTETAKKMYRFLYLG